MKFKLSDNYYFWLGKRNYDYFLLDAIWLGEQLFIMLLKFIFDYYLLFERLIFS